MSDEAADAAEIGFSVVVPTLNRPAKITSCLEALAAQDHPSFEVIVVDDGSTDDTPETLAALRERLSGLRLVLLRNDRQIGANPSRNRGILAARGRWAAFLDDDCIADPDWLSELERGFTSEKVAAVTGLVEDQEPGNVYELVFRGTHRLAKAGPARRLIAGNMAVRRDLLLRLEWDTDRAQAETTAAGQPDTSVSGRGDEEGLHLRLHAFGYELIARPSARVLHVHPYGRRSFFRQAAKGGRSAAKLVYKFGLRQRLDLVFFILGYGLFLPGLILSAYRFAAWWPMLPSLAFLALAVAAISYNDLMLKGKTIPQFVQGFPVLLAYYHVRLWNYCAESLRLRFTKHDLQKVDLAAEARAWHES